MIMIHAMNGLQGACSVHSPLPRAADPTRTPSAMNPEAPRNPSPAQRTQGPALIIALALLGAGCGDAAAPDGARTPAALAAPSEHLSPAGPDSGEPNLFAADDGTLYMTWFQRLPENEGRAHALLLSTLAPGTSEGWTPTRTVAAGRDFWVNWADFPSVHALPGGLLAVHWPERSGAGTYDYDVMVSWSEDGGATWSSPITPHRDGVPAEHGFVSFFPVDDRTLGAVWLDGRHYAGWDEAEGHVGHAARPDDPEMSLRFTTLSPATPPEAGLGVEELLDARICDCCQTSAALTDRGPVVVYRDRSPDEIRDISILRREGTQWTSPRPVHEDGWEIAACPVNGPMVAARGTEVVVAWFTAAGDEPKVLAAFSSDAGDTFGAPIRVDDGDPGGRVAVVLLESGEAIVSWLERRSEGGEILMRRVAAVGRAGPIAVIAESSAVRSSGFPRMVRAGERLVFAWTDAREGTARQVRTASLQLNKEASP
jgi:hypothetical protein